MAGSTDWAGLLIAGGVLIGGYYLISSGTLQQLAAGLQRPMGPGGGYCQDGSTPNSATGLCANGTAPTTVPVGMPPGQPGYPGAPGQPCYGQDMYTGQPCACPSPYTTGSLLGQPPASPTCNCQNCGGGFGQQSPYGSPYGQSPYGQYPGQMPYGQPPGLGIGIGGTPMTPYPYSPYPYSPSPLIGGGGYPYPSLGGMPYPTPPIYANPIAVPYGGGGFGGLGFGGGGGGGGGFGGGGGGGPFGLPGLPGTTFGFGSGGFRHAFQGTSDLNGYAGKAIAADGFGLA